MKRNNLSAVPPAELPAVLTAQLPVLVFFLFFNSALTVLSQDYQSMVFSQSGNMIIYSIESSPMTGEQKNEAAMTAFVTGTRLMTENRLDEAQEYLLQAVAFAPEFVDAMDHLGIICRIQNRLAQAEEWYLKSISVNSKNKVPYINLAVVYRLQDRLNDAFQLYRKLIEIDPSDPEGFFGVGTIFFLAENYDASHIFFDTAIALYSANNSPYVYHAYHYKGLMYYYAKNYEEALRYLEEVKNSGMNLSGLDILIDEIRRLL